MTSTTLLMLSSLISTPSTLAMMSPAWMPAR